MNVLARDSVAAEIGWVIVTPTMQGSLPLLEFASRISAPIIILPLEKHDNKHYVENENIRLHNLWDAVSVYGAIPAIYGNL